MAERGVPLCDVGGCSNPATCVVEWHEAEPLSCDEHYIPAPEGLFDEDKGNSNS